MGSLAGRPAGKEPSTALATASPSPALQLLPCWARLRGGLLVPFASVQDFVQIALTF